MKSKYNPIENVELDGFPVMEVGAWAQKKYKLVGHFCNIFTTAMRGKWNLIYLDIFSGPGHVQIKSNKQIVKNSALIAMSIPHLFDHYILNDYNTEYCEAMNKRIKRIEKEISFTIYNEDANSCISRIMQERPVLDNGKRNLTFCFLDPFSLNLNFDTIRVLAKENVDILMLHAMQMDGKRNLTYYIKNENERIASFTGNPKWRETFEEQGNVKPEFIRFLSNEFDKSIAPLGYKVTEREMITNDSGMGIYYLAFYSKHDLGIKFFNEARKRVDDQFELF